MLKELSKPEPKPELVSEQSKQRLRQTPVRNNLIKLQSTPSPTRKKDPVEQKKAPHVTEVVQSAEQLFSVVHLMHEELKLSKMLYPVEGPKLRRFLFALALVLP